VLLAAANEYDDVTRHACGGARGADAAGAGMAIYTRGGDGGQTSLADGSRVSKTHPRIEAVGAIDEASSAIGAALALTTDATLVTLLTFAQQRLLNCSSRIASPMDSLGDGSPLVDEDDALALERAVDHFESVAGPLKGFVLPGGSRLSAALHVARATVRRAERRIASLLIADECEDDVARFVNRLSDALFSAGRYALTLEGEPEQHWDPEAPRPSL
jgi:cob(I)alamin adenosyltransferase